MLRVIDYRELSIRAERTRDAAVIFANITDKGGGGTVYGFVRRETSKTIRGPIDEMKHFSVMFGYEEKLYECGNRMMMVMVALMVVVVVVL